MERYSPDHPLEWLRHANSDLQLARIGHAPGVMLEELCFHAQQATEKAIKALLVLKSVDFGKTHNIDVLLELLPPDISIPSAVEKSVALTKYAVETRYPGTYDDVTEEDYAEALKLAEVVVEWAAGIAGSGACK